MCLKLGKTTEYGRAMHIFKNYKMNATNTFATIASV